uniref:Transmembrane protein n=1 Tax=Caenorhabditis tropicalis TaxID=1561998 RepID=A0A1I7UQV6_9PELO
MEEGLMERAEVFFFFMSVFSFIFSISLWKRIVSNQMRPRRTLCKRDEALRRKVDAEEKGGEKDRRKEIVLMEEGRFG